jgi:tetrahydromethanopterin S-methyltransferase subunit B
MKSKGSRKAADYTDIFFGFIMGTMLFIMGAVIIIFPFAMKYGDIMQ